MRALFMRGAFTAADAHAAGRDAGGLRHRPVAVRADPQRGRDLPCARRHRDAGQGRADRRRGQHRLQDLADGPARAGRPRARDLDRRLDQSRPGDLVCRIAPAMLRIDRAPAPVARSSSPSPASYWRSCCGSRKRRSHATCSQGWPRCSDLATLLALGAIAGVVYGAIVIAMFSAPLGWPSFAPPTRP